MIEKTQELTIKVQMDIASPKMTSANLAKELTSIIVDRWPSDHSISLNDAKVITIADAKESIEYRE